MNGNPNNIKQDKIQNKININIYGIKKQTARYLKKSN